MQRLLVPRSAPSTATAPPQPRHAGSQPSNATARPHHIRSPATTDNVEPVSPLLPPYGDALKNSQRRRVVTTEEKLALSHCHPSYVEVLLKSGTKSPERRKEKDEEKLVEKKKEERKTALGEGEIKKLGFNYEIFQNSPFISKKIHIGPSNREKIQNDLSTSKKLQVGLSTSAKHQSGPSTSRILQNSPSTSKKLQSSPSGSKNFQFSPSISAKIEFGPIKCENRFQALEDDPIVCKAGKSCVVKEREWIFDCGATDTMTFDRADLGELTKSKRSYVQLQMENLPQSRVQELFRFPLP